MIRFFPMLSRCFVPSGATKHDSIGTSTSYLTLSPSIFQPLFTNPHGVSKLTIGIREGTRNVRIWSLP